MTERPALPNTVGLAGTMRDFMEWSRATFPHATAADRFTRLVEELDELGSEIMSRPLSTIDPEDESDELLHEAWVRRMEGELADVLALAYGIAMSAGLDPVRGLRKKLTQNQRRAWDPSTQKHIE